MDPDDDNTPLNASQLAKALGKSRWYVSAMKLCGYRFKYGMTTTKSHALAWLEANPGFRSQEYKLLCRLRSRGRKGSQKCPSITAPKITK